MSKYKFEGYTITNCGYHQPDHCVWWEAIDDSGCACFHATTLREIEFMILESKWKDEHKREIEELRCRIEVAEEENAQLKTRLSAVVKYAEENTWDESGEKNAYLDTTTRIHNHDMRAILRAARGEGGAE